MSGASRGAKKISIWCQPSEFTPKHPAGGYYLYHDDPAVRNKGKTKRQRKIDRQKPLPGSNNNNVA